MRNVVWSGFSIVVFTVGLSGGVAAADDSKSLGDKIDAGQAAVTSWQVDITNPGGENGSIVFVRGVGSRYTSDKATIYMVGPTMYQRTTGTGWRKYMLDPSDLATLARSTTHLRSAEPLPDRTEDGVTVGVVKTTVTMTLPGLDPVKNTIGPAVCTYDKVTFLFRTCTFGQTVMQYSHYGDPSLTIEVPTEAKDAPTTTLPSILPHSSPQPT